MGNRSKDSEKQDPFKRWVRKAWNPDTGAMSLTMYELNTSKTRLEAHRDSTFLTDKHKRQIRKQSSLITQK